MKPKPSSIKSQVLLRGYLFVEFVEEVEWKLQLTLVEDLLEVAGGGNLVMVGEVKGWDVLAKTFRRHGRDQIPRKQEGKKSEEDHFLQSKFIKFIENE